MLKLGELKHGDIVTLNDEGVQREGTVVKVSHEDRQALINNGVQEFWYDLDHIQPIPLDEKQLLRLGFTREEMNGSEAVKYKKDSFRLVLPKDGDFSHVEMWWREDRRHFDYPLGVHELQNLYLDMTKVPLEMH
ncbi:MAG TPA: hypothetical protein PLV32_09475 [Chitinophagaceae bacterium]|nr:hypothetical protein [Chitinophagaceae bacterium]